MASLFCNNIIPQISGISAVIGATKSLFVNHTTGDDANTGTNDKPFKTIGAAIAKATSNTNIYISGGSYAENLVVSALDKLKLIGESRDGVNTVRITPAAGIALTVDAQEFEASGLAFIGANTNIIQISGSKNVLRNIYIEAGANGIIGILALDADELLIEDLYADGKIKNNVIGVMFSTDTVDAVIQKSYLTGWGSGLGGGANQGYAIGRNNSAHRITIIDNKLISNWVGVYWYAPVGATTLEGDCVCNNMCMDNSSYDFWDTHDWPMSANLIDGNFYGYNVSPTENWYDDYNGDGVADFIAICGTSNLDRHPRPSPISKHGVVGIPRRSVV